MSVPFHRCSIAELRLGIAEKKFSAGEIAEACIARIDRSKDLNCFLESDADHIRAQARAADARIAAGEEGRLLGVPVAVKDNLVVKGRRTTCGSKILQNFISPYDATVVRKLSAAGAVIVGKTNLDEFAMGSSNENSAYGAVKNPWNKEFVPGGSSGGSAAATAAGLACGAFGSDTGGSIRQPASFCGVVGLKPTYGRVSRYGLVAFASSLDQVGPFARSVKDCAELTEVISGHDSADSTSVQKPVPPFASFCGEEIKGLRIGLPQEYFIKGLHPEVDQAVRGAVAHFESLGATIVEVSLPHTELALATYYIIAPAEASSNLARFDGVRYGHRAEKPVDLNDLYERSRAEGFGPEVKRRIMIGSYVLSAGYYDAYYRRAQRVRALIAADFKSVFDSKCDLIVCPTAPTPPFKLGDKTTDPLSMYLSDVFTIPVNLAGLPGMSIPCGFSTAGLPIGLQLIGRPWDEETLFKVAAQYEATTPWRRSPE